MKQILNSVITLYIPVSDGKYVKRSVPSVMTDFSESLTDGIDADICIPLYFKRASKYVSPDRFEAKKGNQFTVFVGQKLVIGDSESDVPPDDALNLLTLRIRTLGSRRMHHLRIRAASKIPQEDTYYE
jgi:hypothetical protein